MRCHASLRALQQQHARCLAATAAASVLRAHLERVELQLQEQEAESARHSARVQEAMRSLEQQRKAVDTFEQGCCRLRTATKVLHALLGTKKLPGKKKY